MFDVTSNMDAVLRRLDQLATRQLPFAVSRALNDTITDVRDANRAEMERAFDRPTPYTLNAFEVKMSSKDRLVAELRPKAQAGKRDYLGVEAKGGPRRSTALEGLLARRLAVSTALAAILPADNARLDQYGNWSNGQRNEVLAALGAQRDRSANRSAASFARKKNPSKYFVPVSGLPSAVYERTARGQLKVVLAFTAAAPVYQPRFEFQDVAEAKAREVFAGHLANRFAEAMASAR